MVMVKEMMPQVAMLMQLMLMMLLTLVYGDAEDGLSNERLGLGSVIVDLAWIVLITHLNHTPNPTLPTSLYHSVIVQYVSLMNSAPPL